MANTKVYGKSLAYKEKTSSSLFLMAIEGAWGAGRFPITRRPQQSGSWLRALPKAHALPHRRRPEEAKTVHGLELLGETITRVWGSAGKAVDSGTCPGGTWWE